MKNKKKRPPILNIIREVTDYDFADDPRRKKASKNDKFKIVFFKPKPGENSNIPLKFQGVQYFKSKNDAKKALEERLKITILLKEKKKKDMMGNTRNPNIHKVGIKFGIDKDPLSKEKKQMFKKKINRAVELLKKGKSNSEAQYIINRELNDRKDNYTSGTAEYIRLAEKKLK